MAGAKREPSSLVQLTMQIGASVSIPASLSVRATSSAASVPRTPSYFPPVGWVSRCEPSPTGGLVMSRPLRKANIEPSVSTFTSRPAASHALRNQSRTCLSSAESVKRRTPPLGVAPNFAVSWIVPHRRAESICRLDAARLMRLILQEVRCSMACHWRGVNREAALCDLAGKVGNAFDGNGIRRGQPACREAERRDTDVRVDKLQAALSELIFDDGGGNDGDAQPFDRHVNDGRKRGAGVEPDRRQVGLVEQGAHHLVRLGFARKGDDRICRQIAQQERAVADAKRRTGHETDRIVAQYPI